MFQTSLDLEYPKVTLVHQIRLNSGSQPRKNHDHIFSNNQGGEVLTLNKLSKHLELRTQQDDKPG